MAQPRSGHIRQRSPQIGHGRWAWIAFLALPTATALSQTDSMAVPISPIVVTVTRTPERSVLRSPFAISVIEPDSARFGRRPDLDRSLTLIPGLNATTRNNPSQDPRISIRGFGSRSAFGVRGIRILRDGIPLTLPDGQTPVDYLSLVSVGRIEVLRGAGSVLYGNASGGVVDFRTAPPSARALSGEVAASAGPSNYHRTVIAGSGTNGRLTYTGDAAFTASDGERAHSRQRSLLAFARSTIATGSGEVAFSAMGLHNPLAQNPGALTLDELKSDTRAADPFSIRRDARKSVQQLQLGSTYTRPLPNGRLWVAAFGGVRALENPLTFAIVDVHRSSAGASALINRRTLLAGIQHSLTAGVDLQAQRDWRDNHLTCIDTVAVAVSVSCPDPGSERGRLTLRQREQVASAGGYL
ncbi:MAG: TonB-dependent receptor plug domain-containing protein, partial [Gemmatimonadaceae bacterium]